MKRIILFFVVLLGVPLLAPAQAITRYPVQFSGQYHGSWTYSFGDMAVDKGVAYFSIKDGNKGHTPGVSPTYWQKAATPPPVATVTPTPAPKPPATGGVPALINHAAATSGTTAPIPTTGANVAVVCAPTGHPVSDSASNTWTPLTRTSIGGYDGTNVQMYAAFGLKTSPSHTFTVGDGVPFTVQAFSNIASLDQATVTNGPSYPQSVGPITPSTPNEVVIGCTNGNMNPVANAQANTLTVPVPFTLSDFTPVTSANGWPPATGSAYAILAAPAPVSIPFNLSQRNGQASAIASFFSIGNAPAPTMSFKDPAPEALLNIAYQVPASCPTVQNGVQPFSFALAGGSLAPGLSVDPATGCLTGKPTATATAASYAVRLTDAMGKTATASNHISVAATPIALAGTVCPTAKQLQPYSCTALHATGGIGALHYATSSDPSFQGMPGGMSVNATTGAISSARVMDQGNYSNVGFSACDNYGGCAAATIALNIDGDNSFGGVKLFPADSVYHLKVRDLPNDTTIRGAIPNYYAGVALQAEFGPGAETGGMPINTWPENTPFVPVKTDNGGNQFTSGPIPCTSGMEGDRNQLPVSEANGEPDLHVLGVYLPGTGADGQAHPAQLWEMYNTYPVLDAKGNCTWGNPKDAQGGGYGGARFPRPGGADADVQTSYEMPNAGATVDAAGLPVAPLLVNYDEVAGGCARGAECGTIKHPIRMTVERLGQFYQWPATASAPVIHDNCPQAAAGFGGGDIQPWDQAHPLTCYDGNGNPITTQGQTTVTAGQIFHLPPGTPEPPACAANPVNHILFQALIDYGVIPADNGLTGRLIGTKDNRWPDWGTLNACLTQFRLGQMVVANVSGTAVDPKYGSSQVQLQYVAK